MKKLYTLLLAALFLCCVGCGVSGEKPTQPDVPVGQTEGTTENQGEDITPEVTPEPETTPEPELNPTEISSNIQWQEDDLYAIAYVGYRSITDWEVDGADYITNLGLNATPNQYEMVGDEIFLVIPRYDQCQISLYPLDINDPASQATGDPTFSQGDGAPFLIFCNQSDIFSNTQIDITCGDQSASFSPQMSLRDGDLCPVEGGQDVTAYSYPRYRDSLAIDGSLELTFSSGAGAWYTGLILNEDGTFHGDFHDSDMTTVYYCNFSGYFSDLCQVDDHSYSLTLENLVIEEEEGTTSVDGELTYIASAPYGLAGGSEFMLYLPETPVEELSEDLLSWWPGRWDNPDAETLGYYGLCNLEEQTGFFGHEVLQ